MNSKCFPQKVSIQQKQFKCKFELVLCPTFHNPSVNFFTNINYCL
uniref:Uncharacterized protein n=1 Tax=Heterorhabditis bacteriophora TaxID=37862 RepID=A0A1I7X223_HETBA